MTRLSPRPHPALLFASSLGLFPHTPHLCPSLPWSYQVCLAIRTRSTCLQCKEQSLATGLFLQTILFQSHTPLKVRLQLTRLLLLHKQCHLDWSGAIILLYSLLSVLLERLQDLTASDPITIPQSAVVSMTFLGPWFQALLSPGKTCCKNI